MEICGFEKFSMVDFDGKIACTVFTNGCNLRCPFCHNAPLVVDSGLNNIEKENEVFEYLETRQGLVDAVCISGGEPTLQKDLERFIKRIKALGYLVKLDTNGLKPDILGNLLAKNLLDYVAMDIKNSFDKYPLTSGVEKLDTQKIKQSIKLIMESGADYEFRTTLISEFHQKADIEKIAENIKGAKKYYLQKYKDSENCISHGYTPVEKQTAEKYKIILQEKIEFVALRGY